MVKPGVPPVPPERRATNDLPFEIVAPSKEAWLKMLVYGRYGVGKTHLAATASEVKAMQNVLFLDAESGQMTLDGFSNVSVVHVGNTQELTTVYAFLKKHGELRDRNDTAGLLALEQKVTRTKKTTPTIYRTIVLDSLSEIQRQQIYHITGVDPSSPDFTMNLPERTLPLWGKIGDQFGLLLRAFRDLPFNVIFVCSANDRQDETQRVIYTPNLQGKSSLEILGIVDVVGYLHCTTPATMKELPRRTLFLSPTSQFTAKDRYHKSNTVPYIEDNPTMQRFLQLSKKK